MTYQIENYLFISFGIFLIASCDWQAKNYVKWQNDNFNFNFGKRVVLITKISSILVGLAFVLIGVMGLIG